MKIGSGCGDMEQRLIRFVEQQAAVEQVTASVTRNTKLREHGKVNSLPVEAAQFIYYMRGICLRISYLNRRNYCRHTEKT